MLKHEQRRLKEKRAIRRYTNLKYEQVSAPEGDWERRGGDVRSQTQLCYR
jgi:hypothetical protein